MIKKATAATVLVAHAIISINQAANDKLKHF
jgi:hypothetical protein